MVQVGNRLLHLTQVFAAAAADATAGKATPRSSAPLLDDLLKKQHFQNFFVADLLLFELDRYTQGHKSRSASADMRYYGHRECCQLRYGTARQI